jgi:hypothetical protein
MSEADVNAQDASDEAIEAPGEDLSPADQVEFANEEESGAEAIDTSAFGQSVLWGTDWTVETIIAQLKRGNIEINPRFQRRDAWSRPIKSRFIESVILGLPVPQVVLAEIKGQRGKYVILDGKQRLLSLMQFSGFAEDSKNNNFRLSGLEVRKDLARKRCANLASDANFQKDYDAFLTHTIRAIVIRNWPSLAFLHVVFQRLNTGSLKLSAQELRQAVAPGPFTYFADDATMSAGEIHALLGRDSPDPRMRDVELLVRFIAFQMFLPDYAGRMKEFLDETCISLNQDWGEKEEQVKRAAEDFLRGILALEEIFGRDGVARKQGSRLFNRSIFDALAYYAANPDTRADMLIHREAVRTAYADLIQQSTFQEAIESDTAGLPHTAARLGMWGDALAAALGTNLAVPRLVAGENGELRLVV